MKRILSIIILCIQLIVLPLSVHAASGKLLKVHFIDVGQADCILVQTPGDKSMLIDAGNNADSDTILSYLKKQAVKKLDVVVGTHPHEDHIGSMDSIIKALSIGKVYMPKVSNNTKTFEDVLLAIKNKGLKVTTAAAGVSIALDPELTLQILAPKGTNYEDLNNYSAAIRLVYGKTAFLFEGDAEDVSESEMLKSKASLKADVLKVGHHGSTSSTASNFLKAVSPKYAVISVGKDNDYGHPAATTLKKLAAASVQVFRTDLNGTIVATSDGKTVTFDKKASAGNSIAGGAITGGSAAASAAVTAYIGNKNTKKFHLPTCRSLPAEKNRVLFKTREDAVAAGYTPCGICKP